MLTSAALFLVLLPLFAVAQVTSTDRQTFLQGHNTVRSRHGARPLVWNASLANYAQQYAAKCPTVHSGGPYGENLGWGAASAYSIAILVKRWADEAALYNPNNPAPAYHFTQVVWKSTTQLGCGVRVCGSTRHIVCEYLPRGNMIGAFSQNVQP